MKTTLLLATVALFLTSRAKADAGDSARMFIEHIYDITSVGGGTVAAPPQTYATAMGFKGDIPKDGPVTMSKDFDSSEHWGDAYSGMGYNSTTSMKSTVSLALVMKDGKIAGIVGTLQETTTRQSDSVSFNKVTHDAPTTTTATFTFMSVSFDKSADKQVADIAKQQNPSGKKTPASIPSENGTKSNQIVSQNVQQNVQTTVSPSAP